MQRSSNNRYDAHNLPASERPKVIFEYVVTGRGSFPFDMLRYDGAWPCSSDDAAKLDHYFLQRDEAREPRSVKLRGYRAPTIERWASFLWSVGFAGATR